MRDSAHNLTLEPCAKCGHDKTHHIYNEGPCRPGFVCEKDCEAFVPTPQAAAQMSDDDVLSGLWWSDPEWPAYCGPLWREYVERKHEWNDYRKSVANVLRNATAGVDPDAR
jgi:hypothetical protein